MYMYIYIYIYTYTYTCIFIYIYIIYNIYTNLAFHGPYFWVRKKVPASSIGTCWGISILAATASIRPETSRSRRVSFFGATV